MIVYTRDDTVKLSGALKRNEWQTIKAAARVLMKEHPEGILIDAGELTSVTEEGARTFLAAMKDIEAVGARILVCNLSKPALDVLNQVPGVRSQLAFSLSVDEARQSLRAAEACGALPQDGAVLVPLLPCLDAALAVRVAAATAETRPVGVLGFLVVPRDLPIGAPLPDQEVELKAALSKAAAQALRLGVTCGTSIERVREIRDGLVTALSEHRASSAVLAWSPEGGAIDEFIALTNYLMYKASCEVVVARSAIGVDMIDALAASGGLE